MVARMHEEYRMARTHARTISLLALLAGSAAAAHAQVQVSPVATTGAKALSSGSAKLSTFSLPVINDAGRVAFTARMVGGKTNFTNDQAVYVLSTKNKLQVAARRGDTISGQKGVRYGDLGAPMLGADGRVLFTARAAGGRLHGATALMGGKPGAARVLTHTGATLAGQARQIEEFQNVVMNPSGAFAMQAVVTGEDGTPGAGRAMIFGSAGVPTGALRQGAAVASGGGLDGGSFAVIGRPTINPEGTIAFAGFLTDGESSVADDADAGVFAVSGGAVSLAASESSSLMDSPGVRAITFSEPSINAAGTVAHMSLIEGLDVTRENDVAIIADGRIVARLGQITPVDGVRIGVLGAPLINAAGDVAFISTLLGAPVTPSSDQALWVVQADGRRFMVAREGDALTPHAGGVISAIGPFAMAASGHMVFSAEVSVEGATRDVLASWDAQRGVVIIAEAGMSLATFAGARTVTAIDFMAGSGGEDGRPAAISAQGVAAFRATFEDGAQGVYTATLPAALSDVAAAGGVPGSDGRVTSADMQAFMSAYALGDPLADVAGHPTMPGGDGVVDAADLAAFTIDYQRQPR